MAQNTDPAVLKTAAERALLCKHTYLFDSVAPPEGWRVVFSSKDLPKSKTGFFGAVYAQKDPAGGPDHHVIAMCGLNDRADLRSIFAVYARRLPPQHDDGITFIKTACEKLGLEMNDVELTGHSLGGYLSRTVGRSLPVKKVWSFSSPGPARQIHRTLEKAFPHLSSDDRFTHIRAPNDILGLLGVDEQTTINVTGLKLPHDIAMIGQFLFKASGDHEKKSHLFTPKRDTASTAFNLANKVIMSCDRLKRRLRKISLSGLKPARRPAK